MSDNVKQFRLPGQKTESVKAPDKPAGDLLGELSEDEVMMTVEDYMDLAYDAETAAEAVKYLNRALKLEPDNIDIMLELAQFKAKDTIDLYNRLSEIVEIGRKKLESEGYFEKYKGMFWGVFETRPFMRAMRDRVDAMLLLGMASRAAKDCEEMLDLCEDDNLGIRFKLMHIYAHFENEEKALALFEKYDGNFSSQMLLPLSVLYFKLGDLDNALFYLKRLRAINKDTKRYIKSLIIGDDDELYEASEAFAYTPGSFEELAIDFIGNPNFYAESGAYFLWADKKIRK